MYKLQIKWGCSDLMDADMPPQSIKNDEGYVIVSADHIKFIPKLKHIYKKTPITGSF
jgi:hypothetical protein